MWLLFAGAWSALCLPLQAYVITHPDLLISLISDQRFPALQIAMMAVSALLFPAPVIGSTLVYLHARREQEGLPLRDLQLQMQRAAS
jgi:hypothetical protein